jgi:signal transduction histidine kinase
VNTLGRKPGEAFSDHEALRAQLVRLRAEQERLFADLHQGEQHFRQLARSVWRVQEDERRRLARELHDGIGQHLTALRHRLEALSSAPEYPAALREQLSTATQLCHTALEETRSLSRFLRPQILDDLGLEAALGWLARSIADASGVKVEVDIADVPNDLDGEIATLVFRVAQEALNNMSRHAGARHAVLRLRLRAGYLQLLVVDDGRGCDAEAALASAGLGQSTGLASMRERVRLFGGQFQFTSAAGEGAQLRISIPVGSSGAQP